MEAEAIRRSVLKPIAMTTDQRVDRLWLLYQELDAIITPEELESYPFLEHLGDLIADLQGES